MIKLYLSSLSVIILFSCSTEKRIEPLITQNESSIITINNQSANPLSITITKSIFDKGVENYIFYQGKDTLEIENTSSLLVFLHSKDIYSDTLLIMKNDTVRLLMRNGVLEIDSGSKFPSISLNKDSDTVYYNFFIPDISKSITASNDFSKIRLTPIEFIEPDSKNDTMRLSTLTSEYLEELNYIPINGEIPNDNAQDGSQILKGLRKKILLERLLEIYKHTRNQQLKKDIFNSYIFSNDGLESELFGQVFVTYFIESIILDEKVDKSRAKQRIAYDRAFGDLDKYFEGNILNYSKRYSLEKMAEYGFNHEKITTALTSYLEQTKDSSYFESFRNQFLLNYEKLKSQTFDLNLLAEDGSLFTFTDILRNNKGKLIYIDYWASWCAPCRAVMPYSLELKNDHAEYDITFVYLSTDTDQTKWLAAAKNDGLLGYSNSFLVLNHKNSSFTKDLKLDYIPRYILLNQEGKIIENYAPGPKGDEIRELLAQHLSQQTK